MEHLLFATGINYTINNSFNIVNMSGFSVNHFELLNITIETPSENDINETPQEEEEEPEDVHTSSGGGAPRTIVPIVNESVNESVVLENITSNENLTKDNFTELQVVSENKTLLAVEKINESQIVSENTTVPTLEQPALITKKPNIVPYATILVILAAIAGIIIILAKKASKPVEQDPKLLDYIKKSLYHGYGHEAIERALSNYYDKDIIKYHIKKLKKQKFNK